MTTTTNNTKASIFNIWQFSKLKISTHFNFLNFYFYFIDHLWGSEVDLAWINGEVTNKTSSFLLWPRRSCILFCFFNLGQSSLIVILVFKRWMLKVSLPRVLNSNRYLLCNKPNYLTRNPISHHKMFLTEFSSIIWKLVYMI
jgi:hypothetical protein